jgi:hypothetical protein
MLASLLLAEVRLWVGLGVGADVHAIWLTGNSKTAKAMVWRILLMAGTLPRGEWDLTADLYTLRAVDAKLLVSRRRTS